GIVRQRLAHLSANQRNPAYPRPNGAERRPREGGRVGDRGAGIWCGHRSYKYAWAFRRGPRFGDLGGPPAPAQLVARSGTEHPYSGQPGGFGLVHKLSTHRPALAPPACPEPPPPRGRLALAPAACPEPPPSRGRLALAPAACPEPPPSRGRLPSADMADVLFVLDPLPLLNPRADTSYVMITEAL